MLRTPGVGAASARAVLVTLICVAAAHAQSDARQYEVIRHEPIDGAPYVSNVPRWKAVGFSTRLIPWEGEYIVLMTTVQHSDRFDPEKIKDIVRQFDQGWAGYAGVIPASNKPKGGRLFKGKGVIAATPGILAGSLGLGAIGSHGIEVTTLYTKDYKAFVENGTLPDYYIYEMGRNWFTFGQYRYSLFTSSFAVHMGMYSVNDRVRVLNDKPPVKHDLSLLEKYIASDKIDFNKHFLQNDGNGLKDVIDGGDRNIVYAQINYELQKEYGDEFLKRFYTCLVRTPSGYWPDTRYGGLGQVINWIASASYGAKENLAELFVTKYHVPLNGHVRGVFKRIDWSNEEAIKQFGAAIEATSSFATDGLDNPAVIAATRGDSWEKRHRQRCTEAAQRDVDVLFVGDSITDGWQWRTGKSVWEKYYVDRNVLNHGASGDRTEHVLWRLQNGALDNIDPAVTVLMIGTNNAMGHKPAQTAAGVTAIVDLLRKKLPRTKIVLLAIFPRGYNNDWLRARNNQVNAQIAKLADGEHVFFEDINHIFLKPDGGLKSGLLFDGLHPSTQGYQVWAETMEPILEKFLSAAVKPDGQAPANTLKLNAAGGMNAIRLRWQGSVARDVIGIEVQRGEGEGELAAIHTLEDRHASEYIDRDIESGVAYRYALKLVDAEKLASPTGKPVAAQAVSYVQRINCGGPSVAAWDGADWEEDAKGHKTLASSGTQTYAVKQPVSSAVGLPSEVMQTERWANKHVQYKLPVETGRYELTLWFAETNRAFQEQGKRPIRIRVNETDLASKLDVFAEAGANAPWAWRRTVTVEQSPLHVGLWADPIGPAIKGLELRRLDQPAQAIDGPSTGSRRR